ncbi:2-polyprenyl-6-methoxyphenol hydroxylase-like FAD-dependent oxidoreductase [Allocatelliglobosispora scoriae]|uniref:2-polyprenyl-6-methoxyphenol hydroxylase-like FAD-dependent oxidoreductase n=1 Tax=Allocatelliglobosispora scoriae TaxID=643052 RepID=A0A841BJY4_9ACTN|nr:FAD-dependent monooxygenase [Allocatelliglobosispora scoriae]MBB5867130.1 2-polyprenyl-6-methoxyphenol hydroxylase-like FAD-dependent oxidoreductase [Allocatelliglobosispora scoriae]
MSDSGTDITPTEDAIMSRPSILISGASIAGPGLAFWLHRYGWQTTIVERGESLRSEGQNVDVRGAGREVARRMGIEDDIRDAGTGERGTQFLDADGAVVASFPAGAAGADGPTDELEILRGELARILVEHTSTDTEYLFGTHITAVEDLGDGVDVTFAGGEQRRFDLVVLAEGMRSRTRALIFGDQVRIRPLGLYTAWFTVPRIDTDTAWARWFNTTGGRAILIRPDNLGTTRAAMSFLSPPRGYEDMDRDQQRRVLRTVFHGVGWQAPRLLDELADTDFYFEAIGQVTAPRWSTGRIALLGDAAYAPSPITGMGTSLALVGAYVLAGQLAAGGSHHDAFASYERIMRPYVDQAQKLPPGVPRIANPKSRIGLKIFHTGLRFAAGPIGSRIGGLAGTLFSPPADKIDLPQYSS